MEPSVEKYQKYQEIANDLSLKMEKLYLDTAVHSSPNAIRKHPLFVELCGIGNRIVPFIIHTMTNSPTRWAHLILLGEITGERPWAEEYAGSFYAQVGSWLLWYNHNSYRFQDDIYLGLVPE